MANSNRLLLQVPHFDQNDNATHLHGPGHRQCCLTSNAMALNAILIDLGLDSLTKMAKDKGYDEAESYYGEILNRYGDTTDHNANTLALREFGIESYFSTTLNTDFLIASLKKRLPIPVGFHYKGSGHIGIVIGVDFLHEYFIINDPYGIRAGSANFYSKIGGYSGKHDRYGFPLMTEIWERQDDGWGRVYTRIKGKVTGF